MRPPLLFNPAGIDIPPADKLPKDTVRLGWELGAVSRDAQGREKLAAAAQTAAGLFRGAGDAPAKARLWSHAAAAEVLLLAMTETAEAARLCEMIESATGAALELKPGVPLRPLLGRKAAVALVPFTNAQGEGFLDHLWLLKGSGEGDCDLAGFPAWRESRKCEVMQTTWRREGASVRGQSWQLPAALAWKALQEGSPEARRMLACGWITTGTVDAADAVGRVELEGKLTLEKVGSFRRWLLPWATEPGADFELATKGGRLRYADTVEGAWRHVTGEGMTAGGTEQWPQHVYTLHIFVSRALGPMLLSIILALPRRVVLWTSKEMERRAEVLEDTLAELARRGFRVQLERETVASADIAAVQAYLVDRGQVNADADTIFNVTGGNLLMRFAIADIAVLNPRLRLVYRDADAQDADFTQLRYENRQGHTSRLTLWPVPDSIDYRRLANVGKGPHEVTPDDLLICFPEKRIPNLAELRRRSGL